MSVTAISRAMVYDNPQIRHLIVHTEYLEEDYHFRTSRHVARDIRDWESLVSLGLYGPHAWTILSFMSVIMDGKVQEAYSHLTHISAEFGGGYSSTPDGNDHYGFIGFPFLDNVSLIFIL